LRTGATEQELTETIWVAAKLRWRRLRTATLMLDVAEL
jgi:hypothetical protein